MLFPRDKNIGVRKQRFGKIQPLPTFWRIVEETEHLTAALSGSSQTFIPGRRLDQFKLDSCPRRHQLQQIGGNPFVLALFVNPLKRHPIRVDADRDRRGGPTDRDRLQQQQQAQQYDPLQ